jgi:type V secretory pathway adhesin AidA
VPLAVVGGDLLAVADQPGTGTVLTRLHAVTTPDDGGAQGGGGTTTTTPAAAPATRTSTATAPAPAPRPAAARGRATPRSLSLTVSANAGRRLPLRIVVGGRLKPATACRGTVTITARRGDATVASVRTRLRADCSYRATLTKSTMKHLAAHGGRLSVVARFSGNAALLPARSAARATRYGA